MSKKNVQGQRQDRLIRYSELSKIIPVTRPTIWRWCREGKMPKPVRIGGGSFWNLREIEEWISNQVQSGTK